MEKEVSRESSSAGNSNRSGSLSDRMAISFPSTKQDNTILSPNSVTNQENCEENNTDVFCYSDNSDSGSDVEIEEDEDELEEENEKTNEIQSDIKPPPPPLAEPCSNSFSMKNSEKPIGRGRGMVKFLGGQTRVGGEERSRNVPIAKVSPSGFGNNKQVHSHQYENPGDSKFKQNTRDNHKRREFKSKQHFRPLEKGDFRQNKHSPSREHQGRFQTVRHPKESFTPKQETHFVKSDFGMEKPNMCFHCRSSDHVTEECSVSNPFF